MTNDQLTTDAEPLTTNNGRLTTDNRRLILFLATDGAPSGIDEEEGWVWVFIVIPAGAVGEGGIGQAAKAKSIREIGMNRG